MMYKPAGNGLARAQLPRRSNRRAVTLIELCMVMAALALIATVTTMLLHAMMRQQAAGGKQLFVGNSLMRLSDRFRRDVQMALEAHIDSAQRITLVQPEDTIVSYSYQNTGAIRRTLQVNDDTRRDEFDLQADHRVSFSRRKYSATQTLVILSVHPVLADPATSDTVSSRDPRYVVSSRGTSIIAELGRDHRWNSPRKSTDDPVQVSPLSPPKSPRNDAVKKP